MTPGEFGISLDDHLSSVLQNGGSFSLPEAAGEFDKNASARFYGDVLEGRLLYLDFDNIEIEVEGDSIHVAAFNPQGSSFDLGFSVNDRMGIDVDYLSGISVAHGNEVPLDWEFKDGIDLESLDEFLKYYREW
jgi:hypothetical protein